MKMQDLTLLVRPIICWTVLAGLVSWRRRADFEVEAQFMDIGGIVRLNLPFGCMSSIRAGWKRKIGKGKLGSKKIVRSKIIVILFD